MKGRTFAGIDLHSNNVMCFASYCRTVNSRRVSNEKKKGENNRKCGNRYLAWAFVEGANFAKRFDPDCRRWFDRKAAKTSTIIATKALACKLAKAAWHIMNEDKEYDPQRMFPGTRIKDEKLEFVRTVVSQK
jgi:transposase